MLKYFMGIIVVVAIVRGVRADDARGVVCLGENLAKVGVEHTARLYLRIDESPNIYFPGRVDDPKVVFPIRYDGPKVVLGDLDLDVDHVVKVYLDDEVVQSWKLSFKRLKTNTVVVWRSPGGWHMKPC